MFTLRNSLDLQKILRLIFYLSKIVFHDNIWFVNFLWNKIRTY